MNTFSSIPSYRGVHRKGSRELRSAVLESFSRSSPWVSETLARFTEGEWKANLAWLDTSGLALYLVDRLLRLGCERSLPPAILERLLQNRRDNTARSAAMLAEAEAVTLGFEREGVLFAHLKGITLTPHSVPEPSLRLQLDLDFLVHAEDAGKAARVLEAMGYARACVSGDTWEFKAGGAEIPSLKDLYKEKPQRVAEIHLAAAQGLLERIEHRTFGSMTMPALSAPDLYLQQALHLFKHLRSAFTRAAWVLEYRRHMLARREDVLFWQQIEGLVSDHAEDRVALGVVSLLVVEVFGDRPPAFLAQLIASCVSAPVQLWIERYGRSALLADFPGTKLYLILQAELDLSKTPRRAGLLPLALPPMITLGHPGEGLRSKLRRVWIQCGFIGFRSGFHCVEGVRYLLELLRFRRLVAGLSEGVTP